MKHPFDLHRNHRRHAWNGPASFRPRRRDRGRLGRGKLGREWRGILLAGLVGGLAWTTLINTGERPPSLVTAEAPVRAAFGFCHVGGGGNCVVDGDTFWMEGVKIRIADIDTPETHPPRCAQEAELGAAATQRLHALLNGGAVSLEPIARDADRYGRKLRLVAVDGAPVGDTLVREGLARRYDGGRRAGWCG